jgi:hypothetical protein
MGWSEPLHGMTLPNGSTKNISVPTSQGKARFWPRALRARPILKYALNQFFGLSVFSNSTAIFSNVFATFSWSLYLFYFLNIFTQKRLPTSDIDKAEPIR